jgi:5-deoxy-glucuronate isomerase
MKNNKLLIPPTNYKSCYQGITAEAAGWNHLNAEVRKLQQGEAWQGNTGPFEYGFVVLSGNFSATTSQGNWQISNGRKSVFEGIAHTLYLPPFTEFSLVATTPILDIAAGWTLAHENFAARLKPPEEVAIEIRGGENATRQINSLIEPGFGASRLVAVEVYTPPGNWSSYPAHKHDTVVQDEHGVLQEACLEEVYFYKIDKPAGFAIQRVYTHDGSLDEVMVVRNNDMVLVPKGYHPVVAGYGFACYYLNFLAGSHQSLANTPDTDQKWLFDSWKYKDSRIPMVTAAMNNV